MGMKTFLKRFVAAFGDAARDELDKSVAPPPSHNLAEAHPDRLNSLEVNSVTHDFNTLPAGYDGRGLGGDDV